MRLPEIKTTVTVDNLTPIKHLIDNVVIRNHFDTGINRQKREQAHLLEFQLMHFCIGRQMGHSDILKEFFMKGINVVHDDYQITNNRADNCIGLFSTLSHRKQFRERCQLLRSESSFTERLMTVEEFKKYIPDGRLGFAEKIEFLLVDDMLTSMLNMPTRSSPIRSLLQSGGIVEKIYRQYPNLKGIIVLQ